jgi:hypothetical protein
MLKENLTSKKCCRFFEIETPETPNSESKFQKQTKFKKMSVRNYINKARNQANEKYMSWTGNAAPMNGGYANMDASQFNQAASVGRNMRPASGMPAAATAPQSQPYIITISNASATVVNNFDVLGAYTYLNNAGFVNGSLTINGVTISSSITNVNYQQFLYQSMNQPFSVGLTYIENVSGSSSQITQTFTLNTQDANGNQLLRTIVPTIDPYQQQSTIVAVKQLYSIDGFTKLTFASVQASSVFRVHFYPSSNINLSAGLQGSSVAQQYGNPNITGVPTYIQG